MVTLLDARIRQELSQEDLATQAGLSRETISQAENGKRVRKTTLAAICAVLKINPNDVEGVNLFVPVRDRTRKPR